MGLVREGLGCVDLMAAGSDNGGGQMLGLLYVERHGACLNTL